MATRPWVLPKEVKAYTDIEAVQQRKKEKLEMDIARAEQYVITYTASRATPTSRPRSKPPLSCWQRLTPLMPISSRRQAEALSSRRPTTTTPTPQARAPSRTS